ncbi:MAG: hypothetical protein WA020_07360 [Candidatus Acidiferrales bacterium]
MPRRREAKEHAGEDCNTNSEAKDSHIGRKVERFRARIAVQAYVLKQKID